MKTYLNIILLSSFISFSAMSSSVEGLTVTTHSNTQGMMEHSGMMATKGTTNKQVEMREMSALMQEIVNEDDVETRQVLMAEHMKKMQEHMHTMRKFMPMDKGEDNNREMPMTERMKKMEGRVDMMQILMDQMITHSAQQEMKPKQLHKVN
jgi:protein CpxP